MRLRSHNTPFEARKLGEKCKIVYFLPQCDEDACRDKNERTCASLSPVVYNAYCDYWGHPTRRQRIPDTWECYHGPQEYEWGCLRHGDLVIHAGPQHRAENHYIVVESPTEPKRLETFAGSWGTGHGLVSDYISRFIEDPIDFFSTFDDDYFDIEYAADHPYLTPGCCVKPGVKRFYSTGNGWADM